MNEVINIVAAIIEHKGRFFIARRAPHKDNPGLWEFPGGKLADGESPEQGILREIREEFHVGAEAGGLVGVVEKAIDGRLLRLIAVNVLLDDEPKKSTDHDEWAWVSFENLSKYAMTPLDLALISVLQGEGSRFKEITHVELKSCMVLYGMMYAVVGVFIGGLMIISPSSFSVNNATSRVVTILVAAFMPFAHFIAGAIFGATMAVIYNIFAQTFGGLRVRWK